MSDEENHKIVTLLQEILEVFQEGNQIRNKQLQESYEARIKGIEKKYERLIQEKDKVIQLLEEIRAEQKQIIANERERESTLKKLIIYNIGPINQIDQQNSSLGTGVNLGKIDAENLSGTHNEVPDAD